MQNKTLLLFSNILRNLHLELEERLLVDRWLRIFEARSLEIDDLGEGVRASGVRDHKEIAAHHLRADDKEAECCKNCVHTNIINHNIWATLISAHHQPHSSESLDRENTSTSMPTFNDSRGTLVTGGGRRTWLKRNLDSFWNLWGVRGKKHARLETGKSFIKPTVNTYSLSNDTIKPSSRMSMTEPWQPEETNKSD